MTHISPNVYVFWSMLSVALLGFLVSHLWKFDHFKCLRWDFERRNGTFKRVMTYSYLASVPTITAYSIGMMVIKYKEGFDVIPGHGIIPKPYQLWSQANINWIHPLYMLFSLAWALEIVSHLEELCFWLFLVNLTPRSSWFGSIQFKIWVAGSISAMVGMPMITWFTRQDPLKCESITMMVGSVSSFFITLCSLRVLWVFPAFIKNIKNVGGEPEVVIRLAVFKDLNVTRTFFRFVFVIAFLVLAADGLSTERHINENMFGTDFLATLGGIGLVVSSMFTLMIFFPRSIEHEAGYITRKSSVGRTASIQFEPIGLSQRERHMSQRALQRPPLTISQTQTVVVIENDPLDPSTKREKLTNRWETDVTPSLESLPPHGAPFHGPTITAHPFPLPSLESPAKLHPILQNYSSPINFVDEEFD